MSHLWPTETVSRPVPDMTRPRFRARRAPVGRICVKQTQFRPGRWVGRGRLRQTNPICRREIRSNYAKQSQFRQRASDGKCLREKELWLIGHLSSPGKTKPIPGRGLRAKRSQFAVVGIPQYSSILLFYHSKPRAIVQNEPNFRRSFKFEVSSVKQDRRAKCARQSQFAGSSVRNEPNLHRSGRPDTPSSQDSNRRPETEEQSCVQNEPKFHTGRAIAQANRAKRTQFSHGQGPCRGQSCETKPIAAEGKKGQVPGGEGVMVDWPPEQPRQNEANFRAWSFMRNKANFGLIRF